MALRLLTLLFFSVCTTSFCVGQHFYVYDEEKLMDSLMISLPEALSAKQDSLYISTLGKHKIDSLNTWMHSIQERCSFSQEFIDSVNEKLQKEQHLLEGADYLLHKIMPTFDSIVRVNISDRIQEFTMDNELVLLPSYALLYSNGNSIDLSNPLVEMLQKTETDLLATKNYEAWLRAEIIRLELDEWLKKWVQ